jgi:tetratricopeptide (TPR) repeat protein
MQHETIIRAITSNLTGNPRHDLAFLHDQSIKYRDHEDPRILAHIDALIQTLGPARILREAGAELMEDLEARKTRYQLALHKVKERDFAAAEKLVLRLLAGGEAVPEGAINYDFNNPLEEAWLRCNVPPTHRMARSTVRYLEAYQLYAYILVERRDYARALEMLSHAERRNPVALPSRFERTDVFKRLKMNRQLYEETMACFDRAYQPKHLARCYRNWSYFFSEEKQWEVAVACLVFSLRWDNHAMAWHELMYVTLRSGQQFDEKYYRDNAESLLQAARVPVEPRRLWIEIALNLARASVEHRNFSSAVSYYQLAYNLCGEAWIRAEIEKLEAI